MAKIEIDLSKEVTEIIQAEVSRQLKEGGLFPFIRRCVITEFSNKGVYKQLRRLQANYAYLKLNFRQEKRKKTKGK